MWVSEDPANDHRWYESREAIRIPEASTLQQFWHRGTVTDPRGANSFDFPCKQALQWHLPVQIHPLAYAKTPNQLARVRDYLIAQRRLPATLVDSLIKSRTLYADARANAVFLLCSQQNLPVGAELRGTTSRVWHGLAPGSQKDLGCFAVPAEPRPAVVLCESAIDAISCLALHPGYRCLSTAGARPDPRWLGSLLDQTCQVYCGFDADYTGDAMADAMIARHPAIHRLRPSQHDWNDILLARR